ncbi:Transcriptional activator of proteases prtT AltName: Full=Zn(2)-C6 zinc finger-containing protein prtT [Rhizoctonia solani AG-1 IB]|uniref:Rhizoctonia solani AG1-IB WGS project CAOJ00000000 data, isolate 7/3/14, contig 02434 n=1 Tax=Thanatephorus cucumeris (strain AG1-IB / isolate 7/3/14) TaxID=1108050 RepID=M5BTY6_THACB|nr:Transcriptional activator of proteases prtT AltName: Full=Zn(2)-C6 zinc finger-containing protein prtT [Rhizoctonia solani AG-1 IB]
MSLSPSSTTTSEPSHAKRKRAMSYTSNNGSDSHQYGLAMHQGHPSTNGQYPPQPQQMSSAASAQAHMPTGIPKRGARACTACRKGKNRCEGESPCRRCQMSGTPCVFEKPEKKNQVNGNANGSAERVSRLEGQYLVMQSQMIGMQSSLDRILSAIQNQNAAQVYSHNAIPPTPQSASTHPSMSESPREGVAFTPQPVVPSSGRDGYYDDDRSPPRKKWPALPGFAPPPHKFATYGIVPSTAPSSEDESEDTLPRSALNAPIEALQGLANAAVEATTGSGLSPRRDAYNRVKKRKRVEPIPRNAFPNVLEKGLVREDEARELYNIFFSGCHLFIPLFDPAYDTFESLRDRTPFCFDAILAVAAKIRVGYCSVNAVWTSRTERGRASYAVAIRMEHKRLATKWPCNAYGAGFGPPQSLEKLADGPSEGKRSEAEERDLVVSARIWLCLYWFDHQMSLGTGHPIILRDESSIRHCRLLLSHPMASPTDVRLVSQIELIIQKTQIYETLSPLNGQVNHSTLAFIRRANIALDKWWADCDELHRPTMDEDALLRKILSGELYYAKLWLVCVALRGVSWDKMPFEQRELAFQAKEAASNCLATFLNSPAYRAALRYAVHDSLVTAAFSGLFLLKVANLFPGEVDLAGIVVQVDQLANLLSEVAAERYALTLRVMLTNLRRKIGLTTPALQPGDAIDVSAVTSATPGVTGFDPTGPGSATGLTGMGILDDMAFSWPADSMFSPSNIPLWLQEASLTDLGLPINGSDGVFLPFGPGWTGLGEMGMPEAW